MQREEYNNNKQSRTSKNGETLKMGNTCIIGTLEGKRTEQKKYLK